MMLVRQIQKVLGIHKILCLLRENNKLLKELYWSNIFNNTINGSDWLTDKSFSPGRWAIGYPLLYVLYRILNEVKPKSILEFGLGQSTKMFNQYALKFTDVKVSTLEHNLEWIYKFLTKNLMPENSRIINVNNVIKDFKGYKTLTIEEIKEVVKDDKFDLILVDAPYGSERYSRSQILEIVPANININNFCIILDDFNRLGEKDTAKELESLLRSENICFETAVYEGEKDFILYCSESFRFLTTL